MKKLFFPLFYILHTTIVSAGWENVPYISPGLTIAYSSQKTRVVGYKLSIGYMGEQIQQLDNRFFCNITFGRKVPEDTFKKESGYFFTEFETGLLLLPVFPGIGIGAAFRKTDDKKIKARPKGSVFAGTLLFLRSDFIFADSSFLYDIGGCLTLPIHLSFFRPNTIFTE